VIQDAAFFWDYRIPGRASNDPRFFVDIYGPGPAPSHTLRLETFGHRHHPRFLIYFYLFVSDEEDEIRFTCRSLLVMMLFATRFSKIDLKDKFE